jgi:hypothetical protein
MKLLWTKIYLQIRLRIAKIRLFKNNMKAIIKEFFYKLIHKRKSVLLKDVKFKWYGGQKTMCIKSSNQNDLKFPIPKMVYFQIRNFFDGERDIEIWFSKNGKPNFSKVRNGRKVKK